MAIKYNIHSRSGEDIFWTEKIDLNISWHIFTLFVGVIFVYLWN